MDDYYFRSTPVYSQIQYSPLQWNPYREQAAGIYDQNSNQNIYYRPFAHVEISICYSLFENLRFILFSPPHLSFVSAPPPPAPQCPCKNAPPSQNVFFPAFAPVRSLRHLGCHTRNFRYLHTLRFATWQVADFIRMFLESAPAAAAAAFPPCAL